MANLATTQSECSESSKELLQLLVDLSQDAEGHGTGARGYNMSSLILMLNAPSYVEGIFNMHGRLSPIISLRK